MVYFLYHKLITNEIINGRIEIENMIKKNKEQININRIKI
jgi:hypothetical protein